MTELLKNGLFLAVVFGANIIQVLTGFAGTMLAMPPGIWLAGLEEAKVILNFLGLAASIGICVQNHSCIVWKEWARMSFWMLWGIAGGLFLYRIIGTDILLTGYGFLLIGISLKKLCGTGDRKLSKRMEVLNLLFSGLIHGMFVSGGALLVVYASSAIPKKTEFRATVSAVWVLLNSLLLAGQIRQGSCTLSVAGLGIVSLVPLAAAFAVGNCLHERIPQKVFLKLTYILLLLAGILTLQ